MIGGIVRITFNYPFVIDRYISPKQMLNYIYPGNLDEIAESELPIYRYTPGVPKWRILNCHDMDSHL